MKENRNRPLLVAVDFSPQTGAMIAFAETVAPEAEILLVHVAAPDPDFVGMDVGPATVRDARAHELRAEHRKLQSLADQLRSRGHETRALLMEGATVAVLQKCAADFDVGMIVVGSHGHSAVHDLLVGSTTSALIRAADRPVVVVPRVRKTVTA